jgi:beta-lactamase superfamily II metal-dependent hydrolase
MAIFVLVAVIGVFSVRSNNYDAQESQLDNRAEIHFLNVGQGDAVLFEQGNRQTLVDTGPGDAVLAELGKTMPIDDKTLENVIISHPHADHLGGLSYIARSYTIEKIYYNGFNYESPQFQEFLNLVSTENIPIERLYAGKQLYLDNLQMKVLWPPKIIPAVPDINDTSLVIMALCEGSNVLLSGDASASVLASLTELNEVDILKVPHHGSRTGLNKEILTVLALRYAVITVGKNSYGHPAPSILALLGGSTILRTDINGTVSFWVENGAAFLY